MNQSITSINELWEKQQSEHPDWLPEAQDKVYVVHGSGSDRDRVFMLQQLGTYILNSATGFTFTESLEGGALKTTDVSAGKIEVKIDYGSGSQERNRTTTIAPESVDTTALVAKTITGTTAIGAQDFKLVCTNGLDIGTSESNAPLHVNGTTNLNGNTSVNGLFDVVGTTALMGAVNIGASGAGNSADVTMFGNFSLNGALGVTSTFAVTGESTFGNNVTVGSSQDRKIVYVNGSTESTVRSKAGIFNSSVKSFISADANDLTSVTLMGLSYAVNDLLVIKNTNVDLEYIMVKIYKKPDVAYDDYVTVKLKKGHSMMLVCSSVNTNVTTGTGRYSWSAMTSEDYVSA